MSETAIWTGGEPVADVDRAYANSAAVPGSGEFLPRWQTKAAAFREALAADGRAELDQAYGVAPRQRFDLFLPAGAPKGVVVFVHGGYWRAFDKSVWSHLATGPLAHGFCVAMPSYTLCPEARIAGITAEIGAFLERIAREIAGPMRLAGHSAGGHLVSRMLCRDAPLAAATAGRIERAVSISGVHDLRPLLSTALNETLRLDLAEARAESPALGEPRADACSLTCWAGANELPEFRRQNALLANVWHGFGLVTRAIEAPGRHHYDVIDDLADPDSRLTRLLTRPAGAGHLS